MGWRNIVLQVFQRLHLKVLSNLEVGLVECDFFIFFLIFCSRENLMVRTLIDSFQNRKAFTLMRAR